MVIVELRELRADDVEEAEKLAGLARRIWLEHYTPIIGEAQVNYMLDRFQSAAAILRDIGSNGYRYFIAYDEGNQVGYCAAKPEKESGGLFLSKLYVEKSNRGRGISRLMLNKLMSIAEEYGLRHIWLTVNKLNTDSINIYKKLGFEIVEDLVTDIGGGFVMDDYKMKLMC